MFPVGPTSCVSNNCLEHKIWGYKPIYLERGRKRSTPLFLRHEFSDINLFTSRGDGNSPKLILLFVFVIDINLFTSRGDGNILLVIDILLYSDINLFTSRGDGNFAQVLNMRQLCFRYKPIYLERGRKQSIFSECNELLVSDINLHTSREDGN